MTESANNDNLEEISEEVDRAMNSDSEDYTTPKSAPGLTHDDAKQDDDLPNSVSHDEEPKKTNDKIDDSLTEQAIDDIKKKDSDELLDVEDKKNFESIKKPKGKRHLKFWLISFAGLVVALIITCLAVPASRYWALNHLQLRTKTSLTIYDGSTNLPLEGATVLVGGNQAITNKDGVANFTKIKYGQQALMISKPAFATITKTITLGFGNNNLGNFPLKAIGIQYKFNLTDYLTGKSVTNAELTSGKASALSNSSGQAVLTVMNVEKDLSVSVQASGYNNTSVTATSNKDTISVTLVPQGKDYYISNATGSYNLYSSNLNGSNQQVLLAGTGNENANGQMIVNNDGSLVALANTRDNVHDSSGNPLQTLTIVNTNTGKATTVDHASWFQLLGWVDGNTIVYQGNNACATSCSQIVSYNYNSASSIQLASTASNNFGYSAVIDDKVYYSLISYSGDTSVTQQFVSVNGDNTDRQVILNSPVYGVSRQSYSTLLMQGSGSTYYTYKIGSNTATPTSAPGNTQTYQYVDSPNGQQSAWLDNRNGKQVLLILNVASGQSNELTSLPGMSSPIRWLNNNTLIFRTVSDKETADYVVSLLGGAPQKITDVTNYTGIGF